METKNEMPARTTPSVPDPLSLQAIDVVEAPADIYHSANSVYTCLAMSAFSISC